MNKTHYTLSANVIVWVLLASTLVLSVSVYLSSAVQKNVQSISDTQVSNQLYEDTLSRAGEFSVRNKTGQSIKEDKDKSYATRYVDPIYLKLDVGESQEYRFTFRDNEGENHIDGTDGGNILHGIAVVWNDEDLKETGNLQLILAKWSRTILDDTSRVKTFWNNLSYDYFPLGSCDIRFPLVSVDESIIRRFSKFQNCFPLTDENDEDMQKSDLNNYLLILKAEDQPISIALVGYMEVACPGDEVRIDGSCLDIDSPGVSCVLPEVSAGGECRIPETAYSYIPIPDKYLNIWVKQSEDRRGGALTRETDRRELIYKNGTYPNFSYFENGIGF